MYIQLQKHELLQGGAGRMMAFLMIVGFESTILLTKVSPTTDIMI